MKTESERKCQRHSTITDVKLKKGETKTIDI